MNRSYCWKITKLLQIFCAIISIPLTFGLVLTSEKFKKFLSGKIEKVKDPDKYIYIQEQFQKNYPALEVVPAVQKDPLIQVPVNNPSNQVPLEEIIKVEEEKEEDLLIPEQEVNEKKNDLPQAILKEKPIHEVENKPNIVEEEQKPLALEVTKQDLPLIQEQQKIENNKEPRPLKVRFNHIVRLIRDHIADQPKIKKFCKSLKDDEIENIFDFCNVIDPFINVKSLKN